MARHRPGVGTRDPPLQLRGRVCHPLMRSRRRPDAPRGPPRPPAHGVHPLPAPDLTRAGRRGWSARRVAARGLRLERLILRDRRVDGRHHRGAARQRRQGPPGADRPGRRAEDRRGPGRCRRADRAVLGRLPAPHGGHRRSRVPARRHPLLAGGVGAHRPAPRGTHAGSAARGVRARRRLLGGGPARGPPHGPVELRGRRHGRRGRRPAAHGAQRRTRPGGTAREAVAGRVPPRAAVRRHVPHQQVAGGGRRDPRDARCRGEAAARLVLAGPGDGRHRHVAADLPPRRWAPRPCSPTRPRTPSATTP